MALAVELGDGVKLELSCRTGSEYIVRTGLHTIFFSFELGMFLVHSCKARKLSSSPDEILPVFDSSLVNMCCN